MQRVYQGMHFFSTSIYIKACGVYIKEWGVKIKAWGVEIEVLIDMDYVLYMVCTHLVGEYWSRGSDQNILISKHIRHKNVYNN